MRYLKFENWKTRMLWALIVLVAIPYVLYIVPQHLGAEAYIVDSGSMAPEMPVNSVVYTEPANSDIETGDVIVFTPNVSRIDEDLVIHRVVEIREGNYTTYYRTKGDANPSVDPGWTPEYRVRGERLFHIPHLGTALRLARSPIAILLFVTVPSILIMRREIRSILQNLDEEKISKENKAEEYMRDVKDVLENN